jgi:hypothetical protein
MKASGPGAHLARISDPALTPTYEALTVAPFERAHCTISTWLASTGETDDVTVAMAQPMDAAAPSPPRASSPTSSNAATGPP